MEAQPTYIQVILLFSFELNVLVWLILKFALADTYVIIYEKKKKKIRVIIKQKIQSDTDLLIRSPQPTVATSPLLYSDPAIPNVSSFRVSTLFETNSRLQQDDDEQSQFLPSIDLHEASSDHLHSQLPSHERVNVKA